MSGKAYTMKEMKDIVDYITEHKAYSDIKGRKMWMDLASSNVTTRTWQSLKETFLKRILTDIHNPYYKLSVHQLASFKQGCDIEGKLNNKLEIRSADASSNTEDDTGKITEHTEKAIVNNEDIPSGEELQQLDSNVRDSTDTLILENCYQTAEEIKKDLQSANEDDDKEEDPQPKSMRDLITYSEPLTIIQATIDDFVTDEEGSNGEPQMQIVESDEIAKKNASNGENCIIEIPDSDSGDKEKTNQSSAKQDTKIAVLPEKNNEKSSNSVLNVVELGNTKNNVSTALFPENHVVNKTNETEDTSKITNKSNNERKSSEIIQNTNVITDSLPNNQEAFQNKTKSSKKDLLSVPKQEQKKNRKRASSQDSPQSKNIKKRNLSLKKQSISDSDTIAICKDSKKLDPKIIEKKLHKIDEKNKLASNELLTNIGKTPEGVTVIASDLEHQDVDMITSDIENPCLKSVSLYEEELSYNKKFESQKEENKNSKEQPTNTKIDDKIVILKSHSDSVSDNSEVQTPPKKKEKEMTKQHRDKAMANIFGSSRGGVSKKRKRTVSYKQSSSHKVHHISSGSSEWTSESDSEFISPPRGRKNKQTRKYLKPKAARILSLEEEGGLFVMYGKRIYPIVKDGKIIKNYVTYTPEEEVDQEESFWKLKYVEEKKRTDELTKLLNKVKEKAEDGGNPVSAFALTDKTMSNNKQKEVSKINQDVSDKSIKAVQSKTESEDKFVKFKFTKNNEELQLEGHWSHVNPVLAQVMQLLQKDEKKDITDQTSVSSTHENRKKTKTSEQKTAKHSIPNVNGSKSKSEPSVPQESRQSTPIISVEEDEINERVNKIENEIFKEIEENEVEESTQKKTSQPEEHITKRKGRPRKSSVSTSSTSASASPTKKPKLDAELVKEKKLKETNKNETSEKRLTRSPKKSLNESPKEIVRTRQSLSRKSKEVNTDSYENEEQARYKFPSPPRFRKSKIAKASKAKTKKYLSSLEGKVQSSPESRSFCSIDSTQGYQGSDESGLRMSLRKKRSPTMPYKKRSLNRYRTNSHPFLTDDITSESSNSYQSYPLKSVTFQNSTISTDSYSTESYRILMNKNLSQKHMISNLEKIDECPNLNELKSISEQIYDDIMANDVDMKTDPSVVYKIAYTDDSTSNVSLPTSPVLSIVENMSISKDLLSSVDDFPVDNMQYSKKVILNDLIKSEPHISMPLMAQDCSIDNNEPNSGQYHYNLRSVRSTPMSETLINKISSVDIKDPILTDSINTKLKDLMLESTKKTLKGVCGIDQNNNIQIENVVNDNNITTKSRKRSSTPRKRKSSRKLTLAISEPCIEEHMESCSHSRKSCPPIVQAFDNIDINANPDHNNTKPKTRQKKDVIKVKIRKPKPKPGKNGVADTISEKGISNIIDDSVNNSESGVFLNCLNDSVDLIHNHSETCLKAHDCMGDSVELLEDSKSVIFLDSTANSDYSLLHKHEENVNILEYELFSNDAQDGSELEKVKNASTTEYHSLLGNLSPHNSLITEDLSEGSPLKNTENYVNKIVRSSKWYLLSEDETTNTNFLEINKNTEKGYGADLNQIFPITCAVPDLSTITEMSNQNEEHLKNLDNKTK